MSVDSFEDDFGHPNFEKVSEGLLRQVLRHMGQIRHTGDDNFMLEAFKHVQMQCDLVVPEEEPVQNGRYSEGSVLYREVFYMEGLACKCGMYSGLTLEYVVHEVAELVAVIVGILGVAETSTLLNTANTEKIWLDAYPDAFNE